MTQEYSFYLRGTHQVETVTADTFQQAHKDAAFLLNAPIYLVLSLPALPPLSQSEVIDQIQQAIKDGHENEHIVERP